MKQEKRGGAGRCQGRKPTGRVRKYTLPPKFSKEERDSIVEVAKASDLTQSDFILKKCLDKGK